MMFVLSELVTATKASACSVPAFRRTSSSTAVPKIMSPGKSSPSRLKARSSKSTTVTWSPSVPSQRARFEPTRPQPTMTVRISRRYSTRALNSDSSVAEWEQIVVARDQQRDDLRRPGDPSPAHFWERRAQRFARFGRLLDPDDPFLRFVQQRAGATDTLLDVGAGTGRFAVRLAPQVRQVVAVDPSPAMLAELTRAAEKAGIRNVTTVEARWEDAQVAPAEVVICAHVVYPIRQIGPFIEKLDAHVGRDGLLYMRVGQVDDWVAEAWEQVHSSPRLPHPDFRLLERASLGARSGGYRLHQQRPHVGAPVRRRDGKNSWNRPGDDQLGHRRHGSRRTGCHPQRGRRANYPVGGGLYQVGRAPGGPAGPAPGRRQP